MSSIEFEPRYDEDDAWNERRGGPTQSRPGDERPIPEKDRSRIIHSAAFRRLQGKTQVLGITESDFHRTRLTHSMEVAQIGRGIVFQLRHVCRKDARARAILPRISHIETIGFAHDVGHPPFGHGGEVALNYAMRDNGGFEGNGQTLRILTLLEPHDRKGFGLDLTRRALLGVLKYPAPYSRTKPSKRAQPVANSIILSQDAWKPPKCYLDTEKQVVDWILDPLTPADRKKFVSVLKQKDPTQAKTTPYKALDTSIMEIADDIAYGVHDFEDGVALGLIKRRHWEEALAVLDPSWGDAYNLDRDKLTAALFPSEIAEKGSWTPSRRKWMVGAIVNALVSSAQITKQNEFESDLLDYKAYLQEPARLFLDKLDRIKYREVILRQEVQTLGYRGRYVVVELSDALMSDPKLVGHNFQQMIEAGFDSPRAVCDYIAGMTDAYASRIYERLFVPRQGSVFERL